MARLLILLALFSLVLAPARADAEPDEPGTARFPVIGPIETLDPPKASSEAARLAVVNAYDQLFEYEHVERPYALRPGLAEALPSVSEDRRQQTIRLREGISYAPDPCFGARKTRSVTAQDVVFCIKRLMDAQTKSPGQWMLMGKIVGLDKFVKASEDIKPDPRRQAYRQEDGYPAVPGLEVLDDRTLRVHLVKPMPELAWLLAGPWFSIYPPEAVRFHGEGLARHAVGAGSYRVVMFLPGKKLVLRANPHHYKELHPGAHDDEDEASAALAGEVLPRTPVVELISFEGELQAWQAFLNGDIDMAEVPRDAFHAAVDIHTEKLLPHLAKRGVHLVRTPRPEIHYDAFNMNDPVVGTPNGEKGRAIRRAISLAVSDQYALTRLYTNRSERVFGPLLPEFEGFEEDLVNEWLPQPGESREETLAFARKTLAEAGLEGGKGIPKLRMHVLPDASTRRVFDLLQTQLKEIGIEVEGVTVTWTELQAVLKDGKAQMFSTSWYADYPDAQNFLQLFYSPYAPDPNYTNFKNKEFDALYEEASRLPPGEDPSAIYEEMQDIVIRECPWRYRLRRIRWSAFHGWLTGFRMNEFAPKYFKYSRVLEDERTAAIAGWK